MVGNRDQVGWTAKVRLQSNMTADLAALIRGHNVSVVGLVPDLRDRAAVSSRDDLVPDCVQTNHAWGSANIEVALHGLTDVSLQLVHGIGLREDGVAECTSLVAALGGFLHCEDNLAVWHAKNYTRC